jgi:hypothetical protein
MDLNAWTGKTYTPPFFMGLKVSMGARKWRCEYCRLNFASFRPRKEVFTFRRWEKWQPESLAGTEEQRDQGTQEQPNSD